MLKKEIKKLVLLSLLVLFISFFMMSPYLLNQMPLTYGYGYKTTMV